jgi:O-antigen/teichoic acid export membrane protein
VLVLMGAFQTAWAPFAHDVRGQEGDEQAKRTYASVLSYWSIVMGWGLVAVTLTAPPYIGYAMPDNARRAIPVVGMLAGGTVLYGGYLIVNIGVTISKRTLMTPLICIVAAAVNLGLNFWAIPRWGIVGAGATTVIGYALLLWLGWLNAERSYPVPYQWSRVARVAAMVVVFIALSQWVIPDVGVLAVTVRLLLVAAFPLALIPVGALTRGDLRKGRGIVLSRFRRGGVEPAT